MGKHILSGVNGFVKRGSEIYLFDPRQIKVVEGWNPRTDFSNVEELKPSIKEIGVQDALLVRKNKAGEIELVDGESRLRATMELISEGVDIKTVPIQVDNSKVNEIDLFVKAIVANGGTPLKPAEEANSYKRLEAYGWSVKQIAKTVGKSETHIRTRLDLANAIPAVKKAVDSGEITVKDAQEIAKKSDGKIEAQTKALEKKKATPKAPRRKALNLFFKGDAVRYSGGLKDQVCDPLADLLVNAEFQEKIISAGFDPKTIKISISQK